MRECGWPVQDAGYRAHAAVAGTQTGHWGYLPSNDGDELGEAFLRLKIHGKYVTIG
jgi:hypothetical protein